MAKKNGSILILDDDPDVLITAKFILKSEFSRVVTESTPNRLHTLIKQEDFDVVILDMNFKAGDTSGNEGLFLLREITKLSPDTQVVMNTAYGDIQLAVECMKEGAIDFLVKPWEKEKLLSTVRNVFELKKSKKEISTLKDTQEVLSKDMDKQVGELIGSSKGMEVVFDNISKVAGTDANVLILGENGTGKELVARAIHNASKRARNAFVKVDLGAITPTLFESELFGHIKGAFTDAKEDRSGRFEIANKGTLFLDEIGNIPMEMQSKLLSALQNRTINRVGSGKTISVDIRLVCATNMPIYEMSENEEFRQDLLYRINTIEIELPPLRDRQEDIGLLVNHFLQLYGEKYEKPGRKVNTATLKKLKSYPWPGNVRELQHAVERAIIMSSTEVLEPEDFLIKKTVRKSASNLTESLNVEEIEKEAIKKALDKNKGNLTSAAKELGMGRSTLYRKMEKYGI
ncbi:MAG: sigma-54 dependent transcriptional regulator [Bacteroidota bacterium]